MADGTEKFMFPIDDLCPRATQCGMKVRCICSPMYDGKPNFFFPARGHGERFSCSIKEEKS